jgi:cyanobactin maturation PatA/PatG family protease
MTGLDAATTFRNTILASLGKGDPAIRIAILDGGVDATHDCFLGAYLRPLETPVSAVSGESDKTAHGTHVASLIFGQPGRSLEGVAPRCRGLVVPIFEGDNLRCSQLGLARAITQAVKHGAHVINISGGAFVWFGEPCPTLAKAVDTCTRQNVLIVAAEGSEGGNSLDIPATATSVITIGAIDEQGRPLSSKNWDSFHRRRGILAPGSNIRGATLQGGVAHRSGASFAAPLVSAFAALLLSEQLKNGLQPDPCAVREALLKTAIPCTPAGAGCINPQGAIDHLQSIGENSDKAEKASRRNGLVTSGFEETRL